MWPLRLVPLPPRRGLGTIDLGPPISLSLFVLFLYPVNLVGDPTYLSIGRREVGSVHPCLFLVPLQILPHLGHLIFDLSGGIRPVFALSLPFLFHHALDLIDLNYEQLSPVPGNFPSPS